MADPRPPTPPHHPTHNVFLSNDSITHLVLTVFPEAKVLDISRLASGKSFNNRIYFIQVRDQGKVRELVLKLSGRFFGADKVENEVASLDLMQRYCHDVPSPEVLAWSPDGTIIQRIVVDSANHFQRRITSTPLNHTQPNSTTVGTDAKGWILMSRRPGRILDVGKDLSDEQCHDIMRQLAVCMHSWRTKLPPQQQFGNLRLGDASQGHSAFTEPITEGLILCDRIPTVPIASKLFYAQQRIADALAGFLKNPVYKSTHQNEISRLVQEFLRSDLESLSLFSPNTDQLPRFTQYDLSPRNILVTESTVDSTDVRLVITGILDFEFAGFFPAEEEFTNNSIANSGDWPDHANDIFLGELMKLGTQVPPFPTHDEITEDKMFTQRQWEEACLLSKLMDDIAPWYLNEGGMKGKELELELAEAAQRVRDSVAGLRALQNKDTRILA